MDLLTTAQWAKRASFSMMNVLSDEKNIILGTMANALEENMTVILQANEKDIAVARNNHMSTPMQDRLLLTEARIHGMADGLRDLIALPDPIGGADETFCRPNGLRIEKRRVPLGVVGIIYESRPNVTADVVGICLKSGNCAILRGGSEAIHSNEAIFDILNEAGIRAGMPEGAIGFVHDTSRETVKQMMTLNEQIDVLIPRGGANLIQSIVKNATIPVIETGVGNCHIYVDSDADLDKAERIVMNAKCSRPSVCNAAEKLLVARDVAPLFLSQIYDVIRAKGIEICADEEAKQLYPWAERATEEDWKTEYHDLILAIKIVDGVDEAIAHINKYNTKHSEAVVTENYTVAQKFLQEIDAAAVYVNASTRFSDGGEFGFGAEIGISTQKLHARGPMGLREMTTYKYCIYGNGQIR